MLALTMKKREIQVNLFMICVIVKFMKVNCDKSYEFRLLVIYQIVVTMLIFSTEYNQIVIIF